MFHSASVATPLLSLLLIVPPGPQDPAASAPSAEAQAKPAESPAPERPTVRPASSNRSVRLVVNITTTADAGEPLRRSVTMLVVDGNRGSIRSGDQVRPSDAPPRPVGMKVDADPQVLDDGRIRVFLRLEYSPAFRGATESSAQEQVMAVVADGKPTVVSESSDASSGRKTAVELTATVIR